MRRPDGSPEVPNLRRLAEQSVWFDNAWAPMPFTLASHMTMLTGIHPESHGVMKSSTVLAPAAPTLAEKLHELGYWSIGVATAPWLRGRYGFNRGFDYYRARALTLSFAERDITDALDKLAEAPKDRPLFLFVHFYDAHADSMMKGNKLPYYSPARYRSDLHPDEQDLCASNNRCAALALGRHATTDGREQAVPPRRVELYFQLYRRGVRFLDDEIGRFISELERIGFWDSAVVVVTADHGEEFQEHGSFQHGQVFRETLQVPLMVRLPGGARGGERVSARAETADIAPTLLRLAGGEPPSSMLGRDLLAPDFPGSGDRDAVSRATWPWGLLALRSENLLVTRGPDDAAAQAYDLAADPTEHTRADLAPERLRELEERLSTIVRFLRSRGLGASASASELTKREIEELKSLGYL